MEDQLYTAAEIAAMKLPGLPTTKPSLLARAEKEEWYFEVRMGLGGRRKVFKIPPLYLPNYVPPNIDAPSLHMLDKTQIAENARRVTTEAVDSFPDARIDPQTLIRAIQTVDTYLLENNKHISPDRRGEAIVAVYNFLNGNSSRSALADLLKMVA
jgi:hypothetical protein